MISGQRLRPAPPVYAHAAMDYLASGLGYPLPLPYRMKKKPPRHYTGMDARPVTRATVRRWCKTGPGKNVCLRLATGVLGIDVDDYGHKRGGDTLRRLVELHGPLPSTVRSSSRGDGLSGIYLYRVPAEFDYRSVLRVAHEDGRVTGAIELVHSGLIYVVCWPSMHPEGRRYKWYGPDGSRLLDLPDVAVLPQLPASWYEAVCAPAPLLGRREVKDEVIPQGSLVAPTRKSGPHKTAASSDAVVQRLVERVRQGTSTRNITLNQAAYTLAGLPGLDRDDVERQLLIAARTADLPEAEARATIRSGWRAGSRRPLP